MRPNPQEAAGLLTFTKEILNGKLNFLCSNWIIRNNDWLFIGVMILAHISTSLRNLFIKQWFNWIAMDQLDENKNSVLQK